MRSECKLPLSISVLQIILRLKTLDLKYPTGRFWSVSVSPCFNSRVLVTVCIRFASTEAITDPDLKKTVVDSQNLLPPSLVQHAAHDHLVLHSTRSTPQ